MPKEFKKVKATFSINSLDLHLFKELTRENRSNCSVEVGKFIKSYIEKEGEKAC